MSRLTLAVIALSQLATFATSASAQDTAYRPFADISGRAGGGREMGEASLFVPYAYDMDSLLFVDLRGKLFDDTSSEGNWGVGYRTITDGGWICGLYGFYDLRETAHNNNFQQLTIGTELMNECWGFRMNGYLPESGGQATSDIGPPVAGGDLVLQGNQLLMTLPGGGMPGYEYALYGIDAEAETMLLHLGGPFDAEVWTAIGGYYFDTNEADVQSIGGPRVRMEARLYDLPTFGIDSRVVVAGEFQYDEVRGSQGAGLLTLRIPFGPRGGSTRPLSSFERRMVNPVVRDVDIVTTETPGFTLGPGGFENVLINGNPVGPVTVATADSNLPTVVTNAGPGSTVIVNGGVSTSGITLLDGQHVLGGGTSVPVNGATTGTAAVFQVTGSRPTIGDVQIANNSTLQGFQVVNANVFGSDVQGVRIADITQSGSSTGFSFNSIDAQSIIANNSSSGNSGSGYFIGTNNGILSGNLASNNREGFAINTNQGTILSNVAIGNNREGFEVFTNSSILNSNQSHMNALDGFRVATNSATGEIRENVANDNGAAGYNVSTNNGSAANNTGSGNSSGDIFP